MKYLFLIILFFSLNTYSQSDSTNFDIDNCVNEFNIENIIKTKIGYKYWFVDKNFVDSRTLKLSVVKPNSATHKPHTHEEDEFFFVFEGTAEFHLNGETKIVDQYSTFYCPPNTLHGIKNVGDTELKYLVIKKLNQDYNK